MALLRLGEERRSPRREDTAEWERPSAARQSGAGYPHIVSEIDGTNPNLYRADFAFLAAVYGSLQGMDGFYAFALGGAFWDRTMQQSAVSSPVILGNFPAHALIYRRGDVREAPDVVRQVLDLAELYNLGGSGASAPQALRR